MANVQGTLTTILRPQRMSPSADVQVTTVRMYGKATLMCSSQIEHANHATRKPSDTLNPSHLNKKVSTSNVFYGKLIFEISLSYALIL